MEEKEVILEKPVTVAGVTIIPIATLSLNRRHGKRCFSLSGIKQPVAIMTISPSMKRAFRITGGEMSPDELKGEFPGIGKLLEKHKFLI